MYLIFLNFVNLVSILNTSGCKIGQQISSTIFSGANFVGLQTVVPEQLSIIKVKLENSIVGLKVPSIEIRIFLQNNSLVFNSITVYSDTNLGTPWCLAFFMYKKGLSLSIYQFLIKCTKTESAFLIHKKANKPRSCF